MCERHTRSTPAREALSRRELIATGAAAGLLAATLARPRAANAQQAPRANLVLLKGGTVLTMDRALGDFPVADVLIDGPRIAAVGTNLQASGAEVIESENMIVMPGFIDTHRHMWEGQIRQVLPDIMLPEYLRTILGKYGTAYRPQDAYIGDLLSALSALDAGVTTLLDWSHIQTTPEHTDAVIKALQESGVRAVFAYGMPQTGKPWWVDAASHKYPGDIKRLRSQYFNSDDQLLTLALAASGGFGNVEIAKKEWDAAREVGARITIHASGKDALVKLAQGVKLGDDTTYVHCGLWSDTDFKMCADSGGTVSFSPGTELVMGINNPPIQQAINVGIRPSLSADAETNAPNDMFTEMRLTLASQNAMLMVRRDGGEQNLPKRLTARDALEFATIEGAKANGLAAKVGSLTPGKQADVVCLHKDRINVLPVNDPVGAVVLGMDTGNVDTVFVAGKAKKRGGMLLGVDLKRIAAEAIASRDYLAAKVRAG
jgi:cytosine/adenosine deaminase-related metal-dependent hydrolase